MEMINYIGFALWFIAGIIIGQGIELRKRIQRLKKKLKE